MVQTEEVHRDIKKEYPEVDMARTLFVQGDFSRAAETYAKVLTEMSATEEETSLKHAVIYLEYANALIFSNDKVILNPELEEDQKYLEDLEIAWEVLEIAKAVFKEHQLDQERLKAHLLLSSIAEESHQYEESRVDLKEARQIVEGLPEEQQDPRSYAEILFKLAMVEDVLGNKEAAKQLLAQVIEVLRKGPAHESTDELIQEVQDRLAEIDNPEEYKVELKQTRAAIDPNEPVQRITVKKSGQPPSSRSSSLPK